MSDKKTILYVDDETLNLRVFSISFGDRYNIVTAKDGYSALEQIESNPEIDAVISDMKMPKMNGIEFINEARKFRADPPPYFILTGFSINDEIEQALEQGAIRNYFQKPMNRTQINDALLASMN
jgi:CheY-like chemotaxis protein